MTIITFSLPILLLLVSFLPAGSACPQPQSTQQTVRMFEEKGRTVPPVGDSCFCSMLAQKNIDDAAALAAAFARRFTVHDTLLFCAYRHHALRENRKLFTALLRSWKKEHPSLNAALIACRQSGATGKMDTLLRIFDRENELEMHQILQWVEVKKVLDDFSPVPELFCRVIRQRPLLLPLALNQFEMLLDEQPAPLADSLLRRFTDCTSVAPQADSTELRRWIIDQYGRKRLYEKQISAVFACEKNTAVQCSLLHSIARDCLDHHAYAPAVAAGRALYRLPCDENLRREAASLLFTAYRAMGKHDSAAVWLEQSGVTTEKNRREAVELYHSLGNMEKAAELLKRLPPSVARDTLYLQHLLLADSLPAARRFAFDNGTELARAAFPRMVWRLRTSFFCGAADTCIMLLDSIAAGPPRPEAVRFLEYRYWLLRLADAPATLAKFIQIEYTLFKGDRKKAALQLCESDRDSANDWRIGLRIARRQLDYSEAAAAVATLRCTPAEREPEYIYCLADALYRDNALNEARELLRRLVLEFPADQYTTRARLLLGRVP